MANFDFMDPLQSEALFPYRNRQPQHPLIVFKAVATDPGGTLRKLHRIQKNENIRQMCFIKKPGKRKKIRLLGG